MSRASRRAALASLLLLVAPLSALAQSPQKIARIGFLSSSSPHADGPYLREFLRGLQDLGYAPGKSIIVEERYASGQFEALPELASQLLRDGADVLLTAGAPASRAAKKTTVSVPIVIVSVADPVGIGLVGNLARPAGNITGLSDFNVDLIAKRLEYLKEVAPAAATIAVLLNPGNPTNRSQLELTRAAAARLGVALLPLEVKAVGEIDPAFGTIRQQGVGALLVIGDPFLRSQQGRIIDLALKARVPAIYSERQYAGAGGLMAYGASREDLYRRAATYVDRILKGASPGDLPVEQPTKFELVINAKTARALGLVIPPSFLLRADQVIE